MPPKKKARTEKKNSNNESINSSSTINSTNSTNSVNLTNSTNYLDQLNLSNTSNWTFKLKLDSRDKLVKLINEYSKSLISDKKILINEKELIENKNNLLKLLNRSPFELDDKSLDVDKISLNLDNTFKHEINDQLMKNEYFIIEFKGTIDRNSRIELIKENNNLINKLYKLPIEYANDNLILVDDNDKQSKSDDKDNQLINGLKNEIINLKEEMKKSILKFENEIINSKEINLLLRKSIGDIINLKEEMNILTKKINDDILKKENNSITMCCVMKDVKNFFEKDNLFKSEPVIFRNFKWYIEIQSQLFDNKRYLGFYLVAENEIDDIKDVKWECKTSYDLTLKSNLPVNQDFTIKNYINLFNRSYPGWGYCKFKSKDDLFNLNNGFVKDDFIRLEINFKILEIYRNI